MVFPTCSQRGAPTHRRGFTLLELLVAMTLTLLLTALVVQVFSFVSDGVFNSRATMDLADQLRNAKHRLIQDLRGITAPTTPPLDPSAELGYFEYVEGPRVANFPGGDIGRPSPNAAGTLQTYFGDLDDVMMFTTASYDEEFVGKSGNNAAKSRYAEIAWFLKPISGTHGSTEYFTLNRRVWLVNPNANWGSDFGGADQSMRQERGRYERTTPNIVAEFTGKPSETLAPQSVKNSLGDLTMRERRPIHQSNVWPYDIFYTIPNVSRTCLYSTQTTYQYWKGYWPKGNHYLTLPSVNEQSGGSFPDPVADTRSDDSAPVNSKWSVTYDSITKRYEDKYGPDPALIVPMGVGGREQSDIILTNVVGFDIKAWDPGAPVFRAKPATVSDATSNVVGLIVPGDPGYGGDGSGTNPMGALQKFIDSKGSGDAQPVSFGAYADLNYMWINLAGEPYNMQRRAAYLKALANYESTLKVGFANRDERVFLGIYPGPIPRPAFAFGHPQNPLSGYSPKDYQFPAVYDTWSRHYDYDGINNDGDDNNDGKDDGKDHYDEFTDGLDNNGNGFIDEPSIDLDGDGIISSFEDMNGESENYPPFPAPLRGLKITIRVMEQDSRQVREVTIIHEFLPL